MSDLRQRVPGQSLIEQLLREWEAGRIHHGDDPHEIVIDEEARGWYLGVHGERSVAAQLATLSPEYTVLHSVPVGGGNTDIDHVVIGPSGVFTINTKFSPGKRIWSAGYGVYVGGRAEKGFIRNLDVEVRRASARLSAAAGIPVEAAGLLVFVNPSGIDRKAPAGDGTSNLRVLSDRELLGALSGQRIFDHEQVAALVSAAVVPSTWHSSPTVGQPGAQLASEFAALEEAVEGRIPAMSAPARSVRAPRDRPSGPPAPKRTTASRRRSTRRRGSRLVEGLLSCGLFIAIAVWVSQPDGQAFLQSLIASFLSR